MPSLFHDNKSLIIILASSIVTLFLLIFFILSRIPDSPDFYLEKAVYLSKEGNYEESLKTYNVFLQIQSQSVQGLVGRAYVKQELAEDISALEDLDNAIKLDPEYASIYHIRSLIRERKQDYDGAIADLSQAIELDPSNEYFYNDRGVLYRKVPSNKQQQNMNNYNEKALKDFTEAIRINAKYARPWANRAYIYREQGKNQEAILDFQQAADLYLQNKQHEDYKQIIEDLNNLKATQ